MRRRPPARPRTQRRGAAPTLSRRLLDSPGWTPPARRRPPPRLRRGSCRSSTSSSAPGTRSSTSSPPRSSGSRRSWPGSPRPTGRRSSAGRSRAAAKRLGGSRTAAPEGARTPLEAVQAIAQVPDPSLVVLKDFHPFLSDPAVVRALRELAHALKSTYTTVVLLSPSLVIPPELEKEISVLDVPLPTYRDLLQLLKEIVGVLRQGRPREGRPHEGRRRRPHQGGPRAHPLRGGERLREGHRLGRPALEATTCSSVLEEKRQVIRKSGLLEYFPTEERLANVGGLDLLKTWLARRGAAFSEAARRFGLPEPKGLLLLGVQGCGKSLTAKAIAAQWQLPLLRLDMGRIFSGPRRLVGGEPAPGHPGGGERRAGGALDRRDREGALRDRSPPAFGDGGVTARVFGHPPHLAAGEDRAGLRRRDREPDRAAAARAAAQGALRRDLLHRPALRPGAARDPRHPRPASQAAIPGAYDLERARRAAPTGSPARRSSRR